MATLSWEQSFIEQHRVARLATVAADGQPHVVPVVYAYDGALVFTPLDAKPKRVATTQLQRVRNIEAHPQVALIIDDYSEDWQQLAWVQVRGRAALMHSGAEYERGIELLNAKYPQYQQLPLTGSTLIVIAVEHVRGWRWQG